MLGVFAAGRILNARTARSQAIGGMIWGLGSALHEETAVDERYGRFVNNDLGGYHLPAHADMVDVDAIFLPEEDDKSNPLKSRASASWESAAPVPPWPTPSTTPAACAFAAIRSRSTS